MSKRLMWIAAAALLLVNVRIQPASAAPPHYETICVDPGAEGCVDTIAEALDQAVNGDIIEIAAGTYTEQLLINKGVTLRGAEATDLEEMTTIHGAQGEYWPTVRISANTIVTLENLRITGATGHTTYCRSGGGVLNEGTLNGTNLVIDDNVKQGDGGGIENTGTLHLVDSLVTNNATAPRQQDLRTGGGIHSGPDGTVVLIGTEVSHNYAVSGGGGLFVQGDLEMTDSALSYNTAGSFGGGAYLGAQLRIEDGLWTFSSYHATLERVTIDHNEAVTGDGGGLFVIGSNVSMVNVTLSGNWAAQRGGAILHMTLDPFGGQAMYTTSAMTISASTIANNTSAVDQGGGIANDDLGRPGATSTIIAGSILANNHGGNCDFSPPDSFQSWDYNLSNDDTCNLPYHADLINTAAMLNPLALNAPGSIETHALRIGSPADDLVDSCVDTDARGVARGQPCDAGAYEGTEPPKYLQTEITAIVAKQATCRFGPSTAYAATGYLSAGETHEITGRNEAATWLKLETCWVATYLLQTDGDVLSISVMAAPPLPTPTSPPVCEPTMGPAECPASGGTWVPGPVGIPNSGTCDCP